MTLLNLFRKCISSFYKDLEEKDEEANQNSDEVMKCDKGKFNHDKIKRRDRTKENPHPIFLPEGFYGMARVPAVGLPPLACSL